MPVLLRSLLSVTILFLSISCATGQGRVSVSGTIRDASNGETLIGAGVEITVLNTGTMTNEYGFFSLTIPAGRDSLDLLVSYLGYGTLVRRFLPDRDQQFVLEMGGEGLTLGEVVVSANSAREAIQSTQMSVENISVLEARKLPALFGEVDIIKTIQLKAGVSSGSEGSTGLFVRGGGNDQNLILLDEALVYNANHLFGFFSVFNSDAIKDVKIYKGGFPAQYSGRLSSVLDVRLREGNKKRFAATGGIGLISSRLTVEGPIQKDKSSFIISGRRTYVDLITNLINDANAGKPDYNPIPAYNFYDLNAKANFQLGDKDVLYLAGYFGRDVFGFSSDAFRFNFDWGNATGTARWNHIYSPRLFSNTTFTYSEYQYNIGNRLTGFNFSLGSDIRDISLKHDFFYTPAPGHEVRAGLLATHHTFKVGRLQAGSDDGEVAFSSGLDLRAMEYGAYVSDDWDITRSLRAHLGFRLSAFDSDGKTYWGAEPRLAARYLLTERLSVKSSYARMYQYVHLISNSAISLPTDVWYPSTRGVRPQQSDQVALGLSWDLGNDLLISNEYYYKWLNNQIDFKDHARLFANDDLENEFTFGDGYAYGTELTIEKNTGKLTGWIAYTLALIRRGNFPDIMDGRYFAPRYDRRHDFSVVASYEISKRFTVTGTFIYGSGDLTWLPTGRGLFQDAPGGAFTPIFPVYGDRNTFRMPAYHRMDLAFVIRFFPKWGENDLTISIYNVYNRRNPYFLYLSPEYAQDYGDQGPPPGAVPDRISARQVSLFPILPSFTWNFSF